MSNNRQDQWGAEEHGADPSDGVCIPIRFVLQDVQIHCDSETQSITNPSEGTEFLSNDDTEMNIFISDINIGSVDGFAFLSPTNNNIVVNDIYPGLFNHEIFHSLSLQHPYVGEGQESFVENCNDVWTESFEWDSDGDGVAETYIDRCWSNSPIVNRLDACNASNFNPTHPCCIWGNQDNNLMAGSAWSGNPQYAVITPCQLEKLLNDINDNMCDYISGVGCAPPTANIGLVPLDGTISGDCEFCIHFESSMNDEEYNIIFNQRGVRGAVYESGWREGPVGMFCIDLKDNNSPFTSLGVIQPGNTYSVTLQVRNECGLDEEIIRINIPPSRSDCTEEPPGLQVQASPNPTNGILKINYTLEEEGLVRMYLYDPVRMEYQMDIVNAQREIGSHQETTNLSTLANGAYYLIYEFQGNTHFETIIKQ